MDEKQLTVIFRSFLTSRPRLLPHSTYLNFLLYTQCSDGSFRSTALIRSSSIQSPATEATARTPSYASPSASISANKADSAGAESGLMYATKEEARNAFRQLLYDLEVKSYWPWDKVMRAIAKEPRWNALRRLNEKKQLWNAWKPKRAKEEKEEERERVGDICVVCRW